MRKTGFFFFANSSIFCDAMVEAAANQWFLIFVVL